MFSLHWVDNGNLLYGEVGYDLSVVFVDDQHFLNPYTVTMGLAVLGFQSEDHAGFDLDRVIE
jgi:hypothetical protein